MTKTRLTPPPRDPEKSIGDITRQYIKHPLVQAKVRVSAAETAGATEIGWYRGHMSGVYDAYLTLREVFPAAARALLDAYGMDEEGAIRVG